MAGYDIEAVRQAAAGNWKDLIARLGGVPAESLDGKHHPCPKCGGTDRFRLLDAERGAVICNQCFATKNGDGFAAIQWAAGLPFADTLAAVAEAVGVKKKPGRGKKIDKDLEWMEWNDGTLALFEQNRPGVTKEALVAAGARMAFYRKIATVYALPIIGQNLDTTSPVGWALLDALGGELPRYNREGQRVGMTKVKITYGSAPGLIGVHAIDRIKTAGLVELVWKTEGVSDSLALFAAIPPELRDRHVVLTNANGASEQPKWMSKLLAASGAESHILHDADKPGDIGAIQWGEEVVHAGGKTTVVRLPYEIQETKGPDVRDWLGEGHAYGELLTLAERGQRFEPKGEEDNQSGGGESWPLQERILELLGLEILYETDTSKVRVFSTRLRKSTTLDRVAKIAKCDLLQAAGGDAMRIISGEPDGKETFSMDQIREAIAVVAASRRGKHDERGVGVWQGVGKDGAHTDAIVLVNEAEGALYNGDRIMRKIERPQADGLVLDFGADSPRWYDYDTLCRFVDEAKDSPEWRSEAIERCVELMLRWRWRGEHDPELVTGLVMATWLQTIWAWRPLVAVIGESACGKTTLFETLGGKQGSLGIFGALAFSGSKSSEAGVRQGIGNTGRIILLDEFERSKSRDAVLQTLRASSRGDQITKGTTGQKSVSFRLNHIAWVAAIESGLERQPDRNRFVELELLPAEASKQGRLVAPSGAEAVELGLRLLAASVVVATQAKRLAVDLKSTSVDGAPSRVVETYAVTAAILAVAMGLAPDEAADLLRRLLASHTGQEVEPEEKDQDALLEAILRSCVRCDGGRTFTVSQLLESHQAGGPTGEGAAEYLTHRRSLEASGVAFRDDRLVLHIGTVQKTLLQRTDWEQGRIDQVLLRLEGAKRDNLKLAGKSSRCVTVPQSSIADAAGADEV